MANTSLPRDAQANILIHNLRTDLSRLAKANGRTGAAAEDDAYMAAAAIYDRARKLAQLFHVETERRGRLSDKPLKEAL